MVWGGSFGFRRQRNFDFRVTWSEGLFACGIAASALFYPINISIAVCQSVDMGVCGRRMAVFTRLNDFGLFALAIASLPHPSPRLFFVVSDVISPIDQNTARVLCVISHLAGSAPRCLVGNCRVLRANSPARGVCFINPVQNAFLTCLLFGCCGMVVASRPGRLLLSFCAGSPVSSDWTWIFSSVHVRVCVCV